MASDYVLSQKSLGFVSVRQRLDQGYFGGYLLINSVARPLEFHCTVPVQPTRAQSILFGPTLEEFLCGEQICRALLSRAKLQPQVVLVDSPAALCVRHWFDLPILWVRNLRSQAGAPADQSPTGEPSEPTSIDHGFHAPGYQRNASEYAQRSTEHYQFCCLESYRCDLDSVDGLIESYASEHDLREPFERIIEALSEAHPRTKAA